MSEEKCAICQSDLLFFAEQNTRIAELESSLSSAQTQILGLKRQLSEYAGWTPDQFLRYQEAHHKLQDEYLALDQECWELKRQIEAMKPKWYSGTPPQSGWYWIRRGMNIQISYFDLNSMRLHDQRDPWFQMEKPKWSGPIEPPTESEE